MPMNDIAIRATELSKQYRLGAKQESFRTLAETLTSAVRSPFRRFSSAFRPEERRREGAAFWALKDISLEIEAGDVVGIVGANGAGKSTLLKILSRVVEPTAGTAEIHGRMGSLLEVGTGFHPELTGRENIFLNGVILGMRKPEIVRKFDEIVAFAGVEEFIDTPVKRYSSGMYVRLAFAVAAHLEAEILLVDEVLAVGDIAFQKKCLGTMGNIAKQGRTILFVSHNMAAMAALCKRCILIEGGRLTRTGSPNSVIDEYLSKARATAGQPLSERTDRQGNGRIRFTKTTLMNDRMEEVECAASGQNIAIAIDYQIPDGSTVQNAYIQLSFFGTIGQRLFGCLSRVVDGNLFTLRPGGRILCHIPRLPLASGIYTYNIRCKVGRVPGVIADEVHQAGKIVVSDGDFFGTGLLNAREDGDFLLDNSWSVQEPVEDDGFAGPVVAEEVG
jgi:lipopolysaccharide transport system ATP-binding protein